MITRLWFLEQLSPRDHPQISGAGASGAGASGAGAGLVRVIEGEPDHDRRDSLAVPVQLADLNLGADLGVLDSHPAERDVLAQDRRPGAAGDHSDLRAAHVHAVPVTGRLVSGQLEPDQGPLRRSLAPLQRLPAYEVFFLAF